MNGKEHMTCNNDCLNCPLPRCKYDKPPEVEKPKKAPKIVITEYTDRADYKRQYNREYYRTHKDQIKANLLKYRRKNREKVNKLRRESYQRNKPKELERQKIYSMRRALNGSVSKMAE